MNLAKKARLPRTVSDIMAARPYRSAAYVEKLGSGPSPISWVAQVSAPSHMQSPRGDLSAKTIRGHTVREPVTSYIGKGAAEAPIFCRSRFSCSKSAYSLFIRVTPLSVGDQRISFVGTKPSEWYKGRPASEACRTTRS